MSDDPATEAEPDWVNEARVMHGLPAVAKPEPPPPDSSDPAVVKAAQRQARLDARQIGNTLAGMMEIKDVRAWIYRLLENCRAFERNDFPMVQPFDALLLARNVALREVAQFLTADILAACPELYLVMLRENAAAG